MHYELYRILGPGRLPDAPASKCQFRYSRAGDPVNVSFDARAILAIPDGAALPLNMNDLIVVDMRRVMNAVIDTIG